MNSPCDICVDPQCGGKRNCNCTTCERRTSCYRLAGLKPTIRITRRCTQQCNHCCFECSPNENEMMSVAMARNIGQFCQMNNIRYTEIMGGEFFCNPDWYEILDVLSVGMKRVRLVSNGDWAGSPELALKVLSFLRSHSQFHVGISKDCWHTNKYV